MTTPSDSQMPAKALTPAVALPTLAPAAAGVPPLRLPNATDYQYVPTYDGSGQTVHPDVVYFPDGWHGYRYWMAVTPNYYDSDGRENPHIVASDDGSSWEVPAGLTNPVVAFPPCDHNSDPDLVYNPKSDELYLYYTEQRRAEYCGDENTNTIRLLRSPDGVDWSDSLAVMSWDLNSALIYLSPAVVLRDERFEMWLTGPQGVVRAVSDDGIAWSSPEPISIPATVWHMDVGYIAATGEYWMLFVDSPTAGSNLLLARSSDGASWQVEPQPLLSPGAGWDAERIYRASFLFDSGRLLVWYSAKSVDGQWHVGYSEQRLDIAVTTS